MEEHYVLQKRGLGNWSEGNSSKPRPMLSTLKHDALTEKWIAESKEHVVEGEEEGKMVVGGKEGGTAEYILSNTEFDDLDLRVSTSAGTSITEDSDDDNLYQAEWIPSHHEDEIDDFSDDVKECLSRPLETGVASRGTNPIVTFTLFQRGVTHDNPAIPVSTTALAKRKMVSRLPQVIPEQPSTLARPNHRGGGSLVWHFYTLEKGEQSKATCKLCGKTISRGKPGSNLGTTSLRLHMNRIHKVMWTRLLNSVASSIEHHTSATSSTNNFMLSTPASNPEGSISGDDHSEVKRRRSFTKEPILPQTQKMNSSSKIMETQCQVAVMNTFEKGQKYYPNRDKMGKFNFQVAKMLVLELLPYQFVESQSFRELIETVAPNWQIPNHHYFAEKAVPQIHKLVLERVGKKLTKNECRKVHISIKKWTSPHCMDYITLTAHWVSFCGGSALTTETLRRQSTKSEIISSFRQHATLYMQRFDRRAHKPADVLEKLKVMVETWLSPRCLLVGFLSADSDPNITAALHQGRMVHVSCFAHVLNLVVSRFLSESGEVQNMLQSARKICSHFHYSQSAQDALLSLQENYNLPPQPLIIEVGTGWNSTFQMLKRLHEQRKAINDYIMDFRRPLKGETLTPAQWNLMNAVCTVLHPLEEATRLVSLQDACLSQVLPLTCLLENRLRAWQAESEQQQGLNEVDTDIEFDLPCLARKLLHCLITDTRIVSIKQNDEYLIATLLDPRFKDQMAGYVIGGQQTVDRCKEILITKVMDEERTKSTPGTLKSFSHGSCSPQPSVSDSKQGDCEQCLSVCEHTGGQLADIF
ncbi:zinc finger BED domain-containing 6-like [Pelobates cultripes]|uniref:Zinc finger BED domain-containing 6-like n=1 Tax=Pelobates cultripes TaxID=61616 RepID=A0AAD1S1S5_PELCU|nr:zinc finger BED domain-containing 6-like [Pelobates cultripes]